MITKWIDTTSLLLVEKWGGGIEVTPFLRTL